MEPFKTGDTVRINVRDMTGVNHVIKQYNNQKGIIIESKDADAYTEFVEFEDGNAYFFSVNNLELVSPQPDQTPQPVKPQPDFKVGDRVKILKSNRGNVGKKGMVVISEYPQPKNHTYIELKNGERFQFANTDIELCPRKPKLLPFNLEKALQGEKVITRDGRKVKDVKIDDNNHTFKVLAEIRGNKMAFRVDGSYFRPEVISPDDLFMAPPKKAKKKTYWANLVQDNTNGNFLIDKSFPSKYEAGLAHQTGENFTLLKTIKIKL